MKIFLSLGSTFNDAQENYVCQLEDYLRENGFVPQTVGRSYFTSQAPLKAVDILMNECVGTVVVALERTFIAEAFERKGSPKEKRLAEVRLPSVWNQIEAAMAYVRSHPLLVIMEEGLIPEGLLDERYDWFVLPADISKMPFNDRVSKGTFEDWKKRVLEAAAQKSASTPAPTVIPNAVITNEGKRRGGVTDLRKQIIATMSDDELKTLCVDLGVDYENLEADNKEARARELILHCQRRNRLSELTELCRAMRPKLEWIEP